MRRTIIATLLLAGALAGCGQDSSTGRGSDDNSSSTPSSSNTPSSPKVSYTDRDITRDKSCDPADDEQYPDESDGGQDVCGNR